MHTMLQDVRRALRQMTKLPGVAFHRDVLYGLRILRKNPGFATVSILVIALGIGANVSLFTVVRSVLLRPLPFRNPGRLVMLYGQDDIAKPDSGNVVAAGDFYDWQKASPGFEQMAIWRWSGFNLSGKGGELPEFVNAAAASWNLFSTLGVQPALGRPFTPLEDRHDASPTAILSWTLFQRRYNGDPAILGKTIRLNARPYTVVGIMPQGFDYPDPKIQLWVPYQVDNSPNVLQSHYASASLVVARLKPGVSRVRALAEINAVQHQIYLRFDANGPVAQAVISKPLAADLVQHVKAPLFVLMAAVSCLLLIACLNLSNLLVARSAARRKEIAIRTALGSSRMRLICEQVTESLLICVSGGALGLMFAFLATRWLTTQWADLPRANAVHPDGVVFAYAIGITLATGLIAGLLPAIAATRGQVLAALQDASRSIGGSAGRAALRKTLLIAEISLTVVLLVCSGLLLRSFVRLSSVDLGCATKNVLTMKVFLRGDHYSKPEQIVAFDTQLLDKVRRLPGVEAAGLTNVVPGDGYYGDQDIQIIEHPPLAAGDHPTALNRTADPGYFSTMEIPLIKGRFFSEDERLDRDKYVIVNQDLVHEFFPGEDPLGKHLHVSWRTQAGENYEIVGVVGDTRYLIDKPVKPTMWFPILSGIPGHTDDAMLVVRSRRDVSALALPIQKTIAQLDPDLPVSDILTMQQIVGQSTGISSFSAALVMVFAGLSLLLAAVGLYGVLAYLVTQRTMEIGIRMALGAQREQVMRLVLLDGVRPALAGLAFGLLFSFAATRLIQSVLYQTSPLDVTVFAAVIATLLLTGIAACLVPAWRATRIDPMQALRTE